MIEILAVIVYAIVAALFIGVFVGDRMDFVNPRYARAVVAGLLWPICIGFAIYHRVSS